MKNKILSFLLVITMIAATPLSVLAEDTVDKGLDSTVEINIEKNANINDSNEGSISEEDLDGNKEEIFEPTPPSEEEPQVEEEPEVNVPEGTPSEDSTESSNNEGTPDEGGLVEENPVEPEPTEPVEENNEGIGEEVIEGQPVEEQLTNTSSSEPQIFFVSEGLTLTRAADALTLQGYYPCENNTGVDVKLVAIQVVPMNDWVMVGSEVDFKNVKEGLKEFRLTVNGQVIDYTYENGVALLEEQIELLKGFAIDIPIEIEMGPFKDSFSNDVLSLVLVFEEIIDEEIVEEVIPDGLEEPELEEIISEDSETSPLVEQEVADEDLSNGEGGVVEDKGQAEETPTDPPTSDSPIVEEPGPSETPDPPTEETDSSDVSIEDNSSEGIEETPPQEAEGVNEVNSSPVDE